MGPYEIVGALGAGGMGEVFRARDTKLNRDVAVKVLPAAFADDPERLARFTREAQTLASLNHPNVAAIYGVEDLPAPGGSSAGSRALVMELVEGEDLSSHMARGPIPVPEALAIARQIAEALEAAHEHGVVHRDLKPANIKVRSDGTVKVLDFGLAKAMDPAGASSPNPNVSHSPTLTHQGTSAGMIIGTAAYMSPEQAKGKTVDRRADIWAFGVVLYEMLTGARCFRGEDVSDTLAAVLRQDVNFAALPSTTPPRVRALVGRCLDRDVKQRLRDIGEARVLLANPVEPALPAAASRMSSRPSLAVAASVLALMGVAAATAWYLRPVTSLPLRRFELPQEIADVQSRMGNPQRTALSRDGASIAYVDKGRLWVRAFDTVEPRDLGATPLDTSSLAWSPDGRSIAFAAEQTLRTIPATGGPTFVVCRIPATGRLMGLAWQPDGLLAFAVWRDNLYSVRATGGEPTVRLAIDADKEIDFHGLSLAPNAGLIVSTHLRTGDGFRVELIRGPARTTLFTGRVVEGIKYGAPGFAVFQRTEPNPGIWAAPWTEAALDPGSATLVAAGALGFDVADDGTLVYKMDSRQQYVWVWVDRSGSVAPTPGTPQRLTSRAALSPDGRRVVFAAARSAQYADLFVRDLVTGSDTPITVGRTDTLNAISRYQNPTWFPSGDRLLYVAYGGVGSSTLVSQRADAVETPREVGHGSFGTASRDGRLLLRLVDDRGVRRLRRSTIAGDGTTGEPQAVFTGTEEPDVRQYELSPDGRLLALAVRDSDTRVRVRLTGIAGSEPQILVDESGREPHFSRDGRELFYVKVVEDSRGQTTESLVGVPIISGSPVKLGASTTIYTAKPGGPSLEEFDVAPDGRRFLLHAPVPLPPSEGARLVYVQNWRAGLTK